MQFISVGTVGFSVSLVVGLTLVLFLEAIVDWDVADEVVDVGVVYAVVVLVVEVDVVVVVGLVVVVVAALAVVVFDVVVVVDGLVVVVVVVGGLVVVVDDAVGPRECCISH